MTRRTPTVVFSEIYEQSVWGGRPGDFYSGVGSDEQFVRAYREHLVAFFASLEAHVLRVVDLGCGDFRVSRPLATPPGVDYVGIDVVPALVERNQRLYGKAGIAFLCRDITEDELPDGDVCLVRQVLQHLSNAEIERVLPKLRQYEHVFITDHYPADDRGVRPNRDKRHGPDVRLQHGSALSLHEPPFGLVGGVVVVRVRYRDDEELRTYYFRFRQDEAAARH